MKEENSMEHLFEKAKEILPFGEAGEFGFETRLRPAMADAPLGFSEMIARFSWRFSFAVLPVAIGIAVFLAFQQHGVLPEGLGGLIVQWSQYFPVEI